jgi:hypothetical protein
MGGYHSSRWGDYQRKKTTEDFLSLDLRRLRQKGLFEPGLDFILEWRWNGEKIGSLNYFIAEDRMVLRYRYREGGEGDGEPVLQAVGLTWTSCNFGGRRPWFLCRCGRRVALLYAAGKYFLCRHCYNLTYASCNEDWLERAERRRGKVLQKLGRYQPWRGFVPEKKRWMHKETYDRLCRQLNWTELECLFGDKRGRTRIWDYLNSYT